MPAKGATGPVWRSALGLWRGLAARWKSVSSSGRPGRERRQSLRFSSGARIAWRPALGGESSALSGAVRNVSFGGISLLLDHQVRTGMLLHVDAPGPAAPRLLACVAHVTPGGASAWSVGCSFIRELSDQELRRFL